jgi:hypothetical protein
MRLTCLGLLLLHVACAGSEPAPQPRVTPQPASQADPATALAAFAFPLQGQAYRATCSLELNGPDGQRLGRAEETARLLDQGDGAWEAAVERSHEDRFVRGAFDSFTAVMAAGKLYVRRQKEPFAAVANLHGQAELYRQAALGTFPALIKAFAPLARREGGEVALALNPASGNGVEEVEAGGGERWEERWRRSARAGRLEGRVAWPDPAGSPTGGSLKLEALLSGSLFSAECAFTLAPLQAGERVQVPEDTVDLARPRDLAGIQRLLKAVQSGQAAPDEADHAPGAPPPTPVPDAQPGVNQP